MSRLQILLGTYVLYDTNDAPGIAISGAGGEGWKWIVEVVEPIRGVEIVTIPREVARTDLRFTLCKEHASYADAAIALLTDPLNIQRGGQVQIKVTPDTGKSTILYLTQGQLESVGNPTILGSRTWHTYSLIGGRWVTKLPAS